MKEQIKSRMEELLQQELEARAALAKSTLGSRSSLSKSAAEVKAAATTSSGVNSTMSERHRASEEAKADVLFNMDRGGQYGTVVLVYRNKLHHTVDCIIQWNPEPTE